MIEIYRIRANNNSLCFSDSLMAKILINQRFLRETKSGLKGFSAMLDANSLTTIGSVFVNASIVIDESSWPDTPLVRARVKRVVDGDTFVAALDDGAISPAVGVTALGDNVSALGDDVATHGYGAGVPSDVVARERRAVTHTGVTVAASADDVAARERRAVAHAEATTVRVRLIGINAAESVAPQAWRNCAEGVAASECLKKLLPCGTCVWLQRDVSDVDEYGRLLRYVWLKQPVRVDSTSEIRAHMLNAILIERGIASARSYPPDTSLDLLFARLED